MTTLEQRAKMLKGIRSEMVRRGMWAYVVPTDDPHMSEYVPVQYKRREAITGFTGSAGLALVVADGRCLLWTDSRYFLQAADQLAGGPWVLMRSRAPGVPTLEEWLKQELKPESEEANSPRKVGIDPTVCSAAFYDSLTAAVSGPEGVLLDPENLVDLVWQTRGCTSPSPSSSSQSCSSARVLPLTVCGEAVGSKVQRVLSAAQAAGFAGLVLCDLSEVAWLLNLRANDIPCVPVAYAFAVVYATSSNNTPALEVFVDFARLFAQQEDKLEATRAALLEQAGAGVGVTFYGYEEAYARVEALVTAAGHRLALPRDQANMRLVQAFRERAAECFVAESPVTKMMAVKNAVELAAFAEAFLEDAVSAAKLLGSGGLDNSKDTPTEYDVVERLEALRTRDPGYLGPSFETIAGFGPNSAYVHYKPEAASAAKLSGSGLLLLDFGGHYACGGSTDTTRTIFVSGKAEGEGEGESEGPSAEERRCYTTVLRGHIAIAAATFARGTTGAELDRLCRDLMSEQGLTYGHGTGHGVGALLCVHAEPYYRKASLFVEGQVVTIEPGVYIAGKFGVRIENVAAIVRNPDDPNTLCFDVLTRTPLDLSLIDTALLTPQERDWVNTFSSRCREALAPLVADDPVTTAWLMKNTREI